jgi:hypothetical protein
MPADLYGTDSAWSKAFAEQALSDLNTRDLLADLRAPRCHRLQFLQMSAEKLCKAFLVRDNGLNELTYKHCIIGKYLPILLRAMLMESGRSYDAVEAQMRSLRPICREMDMLSPSCNANSTRADNVEYPWSDQTGRVTTPAGYPFPNISDEGRSFVVLNKLIRTAAESYLV